MCKCPSHVYTCANSSTCFFKQPSSEGVYWLAMKPANDPHPHKEDKRNEDKRKKERKKEHQTEGEKGKPKGKKK